MSLNETKIVIRSVFKITKCKMNPAIDPKTGRLPDHVRRVNSDGDIIYKDGDLSNKKTDKDLEPISELDVIEIYDGKEFDLTDIHDRSQWEAIKYSPLIAEERYQKDENGKYVIDGDANRYGAAEFYIERPTLESQSLNNKRQMIHNAQAFLFSDSRDAIYIKARLMGAKMNGSPYDEVLDFLLKESEKNPKKVIDLYTGSDMRLRIIFVTAVDKGIIRYNSGVYSYNNTSIGLTDESCLIWLKQSTNADTLKAIEMETFPENFIKSKDEKETVKTFAKASDSKK